VLNNKAYSQILPDEKDISVLSELATEVYEMLFPRLTYKSLSLEESLVDDFYGDATKSDRVYTDYEIPMVPVFSPEEMGLTGFALDITREIVFYGCRPCFEKLQLVPKIGDVIMYDGSPYFVNTVRRKEDSQVGRSNYFTEWEFITYIPNADLPSN
jgi:hypothetical protein